MQLPEKSTLLTNSTVTKYLYITFKQRWKVTI